MRRLSLIFALIVTISSPTAAETPPDILRLALDSVGISIEDIGFRPQGYWNRFPLNIPYKLTSFDALFAEPLKLYDYSKTMANAVERYLEPKCLDTSSTSLYHLTYNLGVDRRLGGFRNYSANLIPLGDTINPLEKAIDALFLLDGKPPVYYAFGNKSEWPDYHAKVKEFASKLSPQSERILAFALQNLADIIRWRRLAFRNCNSATMQKVFDNRDLPSNQSDGTVYYPEIDDLARDVDWQSLHYAALKGAALVEMIADSLIFYGGVPENLSFELMTPFGRIAFLGAGSLKGAKEKTYDTDHTLIVIDFGNSAKFTGACGATSKISNPVSLFIDLGGDDTYESLSENPSMGAGLLGVGILLDVAGNDRYSGKDFS